MRVLAKNLLPGRTAQVLEAVLSSLFRLRPTSLTWGHGLQVVVPDQRATGLRPLSRRQWWHTSIIIIITTIIITTTSALVAILIVGIIVIC